MDLVKKLVEQFYMGNDILKEGEITLLLTIPKNIKWEDYLKELEEVKDGSSEINYKVSSKPSKVNIGDKCFICHNGFIKGWMIISNISQKQFKCSTSGKDWDYAWYVSRSGQFYSLQKEIHQKGFMGYKYITKENLK